MAREKFIREFGISKGLKISWGLVMTLLVLFFLFNAFTLTGETSTLLDWTIFVSYGFLAVFVFATADIRNRLYNIPFFSSLPRFLLFFGLAMVAFYLILGVIDPFPKAITGIFTGVNFFVLGFFLFIVSTIESAFFQGYLQYKWGIFFSMLIAGVFHMFIWDGTPFLNFIGASFLFLFFSSAHWYFRRDKNDLIPVMAIHTAYNFIKYFLILAVIV